MPEVTQKPTTTWQSITHKAPFKQTDLKTSRASSNTELALILTDTVRMSGSKMPIVVQGLGGSPWHRSRKHLLRACSGPTLRRKAVVPWNWSLAHLPKQPALSDWQSPSPGSSAESLYSTPTMFPNTFLYELLKWSWIIEIQFKKFPFEETFIYKQI